LTSFPSIEHVQVAPAAGQFSCIVESPMLVITCPPQPHGAACPKPLGLELHVNVPPSYFDAPSLASAASTGGEESMVAPSFASSPVAPSV
jgi:hypothetical protein